jgi:predicted transglutaminase-like cysteine proteinase
MFGTKALPIARTPLDSRWQSAKQAGLGVNDAGLAALMAQNRTSGRDQQLAAINNWVNGHIKYTSDQANYGQADVWASAARSLQSGRGDCEDYAIAKFQILRSMGVSERDMFLVVGRDRSVRSDHAVLVVRVGAEYRVLDNFTNKVVNDFQMIDFLPTFSYGSSGSWLHGFAAAN